jgi:hypothetical protein
MLEATIHFSQERLRVEFESDYSYVKWLGYLKEHGNASVKLAGSHRSVMVFRDHIQYIAPEEDPSNPG